MRGRSPLLRIFAGVLVLAVVSAVALRWPTAQTLAQRIAAPQPSRSRPYVQKVGRAVNAEPVDQSVSSPSPVPLSMDPAPIGMSPAVPVQGFEPDPEQAAQAFVAKSRQEVSETVNTLTKEAEGLRARLQKVEAGLTRWKAVLQALDQAAAGPPPAQAAAGPPTGLEQLEPVPSQPSSLVLPDPGVPVPPTAEKPRS